MVRWTGVDRWVMSCHVMYRMDEWRKGSIKQRLELPVRKEVSEVSWYT